MKSLRYWRAFSSPRKGSNGCIASCEDETYHPRTCLVGLEPVSNLASIIVPATERLESKGNAFGVPCKGVAFAFRPRALAGIMIKASNFILLERYAGALGMPDAVLANLKARLERRLDGNIRELLATDVNAAKLDTPALVIHDEDDAGVPWQQGRMIAAAWPGARFMKTQGLGHGRILRDRQVVDTVIGFLSQ